MTLDETIAMIEALPQDEKDALSLVYVNQDREVPKELLVKLQKRGLIVRGYDGRCCAVSYWMHMAWCKWCKLQEGSSDE